MRPHYNLEAWKNSMNLVDQVYVLTKNFPKDEKYGLTAQIRRSAVSVPSNISEGAARKSPNEFAHFINIAIGSLSELETQLIIASRQNYLHSDSLKTLLKLLNKVSSQLSGLHKHLIT